MSNKLIFNHKADDFFAAIGIAERHYDVANYTIVYHILAPVVTAALLDVNPESMSKSQILENTINHIRENDIPDQETALLLCFERSYRKTMDRIQLYRDILKGDENTDVFKGGSIAMGGVNAEDLAAALGKISKLIEARPIAQMIEVLKETSCNYDKFLEFTVDEVDMRVVLGQMSPEEVESQDDSGELDDDTQAKIKQIIREAAEKKKSGKDSKKYGDIDDIIRKAFEKDDNDD